MSLVINDLLWIISDTHFFHWKMAEYEGRPPGWHDLIVSNWNALISPDDTVLHLGDFGFGPAVVVTDLIHSLSGNKFLIKGSHDTRGDSWYAKRGIIVVPTFWDDYGGGVIFSHRPHIGLSHGFNIHGHVHGKTIDDGRHLNASIEAQEYRPWRLYEMIERWRVGNES